MPSSNDLLLEQLRELIDERQQDMRDGISPRALHRRLSEMEVRERDRLEGVSTGRYSIIGGVSIPQDSRRRHSSRPPWLEKIITSKPITTAVAVILVAVASHMAARCGPLAVQPPPAAQAK